MHFSPGCKYYGPKMGFVPDLVNRDVYCAVRFAFYVEIFIFIHPKEFM